MSTTTYTIRSDGAGRFVVDGLSRPDGRPGESFADIDAATAAAMAAAETASRDHQRVAVELEDDDGQTRVLHRYGPR